MFGCLTEHTVRYGLTWQLAKRHKSNNTKDLSLNSSLGPVETLIPCALSDTINIHNGDLCVPIISGLMKTTELVMKTNFNKQTNKQRHSARQKRRGERGHLIYPSVLWPFDPE